jgi:hypothetical protein
MAEYASENKKEQSPNRRPASQPGNPAIQAAIMEDKRMAASIQKKQNKTINKIEPVSTADHNTGIVQKMAGEKEEMINNSKSVIQRMKRNKGKNNNNDDDDDEGEAGNSDHDKGNSDKKAGNETGDDQEEYFSAADIAKQKEMFEHYRKQKLIAEEEKKNQARQSNNSRSNGNQSSNGAATSSAAAAASATGNSHTREINIESLDDILEGYEPTESKQVEGWVKMRAALTKAFNIQDHNHKVHGGNFNGSIKLIELIKDILAGIQDEAKRQAIIRYILHKFKVDIS